eukprot:4180381-Alexandrium_andersonii.AAC.1
MSELLPWMDRWSPVSRSRMLANCSARWLGSVRRFGGRARTPRKDTRSGPVHSTDCAPTLELALADAGTADEEMDALALALALTEDGDGVKDLSDICA